MAEAKEDLEVKQPNPPLPLPFLEVLCKSSGKIRRFSVGTEAGFAVNLINKKLLNDSGGDENVLMASYIEAVKQEAEEEHVSFGHSSLLVHYGPGWKLQTVLESHGHRWFHILRGENKTPPISFVYIGKIIPCPSSDICIRCGFHVGSGEPSRLILGVQPSRPDRNLLSRSGPVDRNFGNPWIGDRTGTGPGPITVRSGQNRFGTTLILNPSRPMSSFARPVSSPPSHFLAAAVIPLLTPSFHP
ncbi:hypothetical protein PHJA_000348700 [Phtheirospermum japonicum]|uniref:Uncharacterized protein n=1 Tax=Phtheirospermum japonicum TaxID=374723 RepID=A0A830BBA2_9LAMI|nr:hypothetical protein PHJA_000348700 [Phtheirospermum japonicum]